MKPKVEEKILKSYLDLIAAPDAKERNCRRIAIVLFTFGIICLFYMFSDNVQYAESPYIVIVTAFVSGLCFGLGIWFNQMSFETKLVTQHLSKASIKERIDEINT